MLYYEMQYQTSISVQAAGSEIKIYIREPWTKEDSLTVVPGQKIDFRLDSNDDDFENHIFELTCGNYCNLNHYTEGHLDDFFHELANLPESRIIFTAPGTFKAEVYVDGDVQDSFTFIVKRAVITTPPDESGQSNTVVFGGDVVEELKDQFRRYIWDFGDGSELKINPSDTTYKDQPDTQVEHTYEDYGDYVVTLTVTDEDGISDTDTVRIYVIEPTETTFSCSVVEGDCESLSGEVELLRLFRETNSHARGFDDPNKNVYPYVVCCKAGSQTPHVAETWEEMLNENEVMDRPVYLELQDTNEVEAAGAHLSFSDAKKYYYLDGYLGEGTVCQEIEGKCSSLGVKYACVYEFFPNEDSEEPSAHFANCSAEEDANNYPYQKCCQIQEDCTNNFDDDGDGWTDTANDDEMNMVFPCGQGKICGGSRQSLFETEECDWMVDDGYCTDISLNYCDFTSIGNPTYDKEIGYYVVYSTCKFILQDEEFVCVGTDCSCQKPDDIDVNSALYLKAAEKGVSVLELYYRCRGYYCSKGVDPVNNPLPLYVYNMAENSAKTRHVCTLGWYWDPDYDEDDDGIPNPQCTQSDECYNPENPLLKPCHYDFTSEHDDWSVDLDDQFILLGISPDDSKKMDKVSDSGATAEELEALKNCFRLTPLVKVDEYNPECCCPVWEHGSNTYLYREIKPYIQK